MSKIVAHLVFNPYITKFAEDFCRIFEGKVEYPVKYLLPLLNKLKNEPAQADYLMKIFTESFRPFAARLKAKDDTVFVEPACEFANMLEVTRIWNRSDVADG